MGAETFTKHFGDHWGSVQDKKKVKKNHNLEPDKNMALSPMTVSQPQCSAVHGLATFSHVYVCKTSMEHNGEHFTLLLRTRGTHNSPSRHQERERFKLGSNRGNTPHDHTESTEWRAEGMYWAQGKLPECNKSQQITQEDSNTC